MLAWAYSLACYGPAAAQDSDAAAWEALRSHGVVLFRHANAPGVGDPPNFKLGDCGTQRNLDAAGKEQARQLGQRFTALNIPVGAVLSSEWCRARDTANLAFPGKVQDQPVFNSFFDNSASAAQQTAAARALLLAWRGPGALVVFTHQVNMTELSGIFPASAEGVVLRRVGQNLQVVGRVRP
nr:histidine phosphatase family protein [uncultured Albidiferax sp.]